MLTPRRAKISKGLSSSRERRSVVLDELAGSGIVGCLRYGILITGLDGVNIQAVRTELCNSFKMLNKEVCTFNVSVCIDVRVDGTLP